MIQPKDELIRDCKTKGIKKQVAECINAAFSKSYETCFEQKKEIEDRAYQQGLEDGRKQGVAIDGDKRYWNGYHAAQEDGQKIYQKGYEDGARCQDEVQYQQGLEDAWEIARKYISMKYAEAHDVYDAVMIINGTTVFEAKDLLELREQKQQQDNEIKVGDEVLYHDEKTVFPESPCDLCVYNPPSSFDGKPCTMCPAEGRSE